MGTLLLRFLIGLVAGLAVWAVVEPTMPTTFGAEWRTAELRLILALGAVIGGSVAGFNGWLQGSGRHALRGLALGALFGVVGITLGYSVGGGLSQAIFGPTALMSSPLPVQILARIVALTPMGLFLGAAIGASSLSGRRAVQGAIGGALGAGLGAALFDVVGTALGVTLLALRGQEQGEVGGVSRGITAMAMGGGIALFIGIVERAMRSAWLRLTLGRNEGKEWSLDAGQNFIGRSETAHVPLFGDPSIAPVHACIARHGSTFMIVDGGTGTTLLNGYPVQQAPLNHGDSIRIGSYDLQFLMKNQRAPARPPEAYRMAYPLGGHPHTQHPSGAYPTGGYPAGGYPTGGYPTGGYSGGQPVPQQPVYPPSDPTIASHAPGPGYGPLQPTVATPASPMRLWTLLALDGPLAGRRFEVRQPIELGRESVHVPMAFDAGVSRRHASLTPEADSLYLQDLGSTNGTFVDGQMVPGATLRDGQTLKVGSTTFRVEANA
jgi:pSer/pThr/pTyr-binding forkhead associated (FHA) protein